LIVIIMRAVIDRHLTNEWGRRKKTQQQLLLLKS